MTLEFLLGSCLFFARLTTQKLNNFVYLFNCLVITCRDIDGLHPK